MKTNRGRAGTSTSVCEPSTSTEQGAHRKTLPLYTKKAVKNTEDDGESDPEED